MTELLKHQDIPNEARIFIGENYSYEEKNVRDVIDSTMVEMETWDSGILSRQLIRRCVVASREFGISKVTDEDFPRYHLPTLVAAVKKLENDLPEEERRMNLPEELKLFATAEFTNARNLSHEGHLGIAVFAAGKAVKLSYFYDELKKVPEFDKYFHPKKK